jgi:hypothetical protein
MIMSKKSSKAVPINPGSTDKSAKGQQPKAPQPKKEPEPKKLSGLDAAALVLAEANKPMNAKEIFAEIMMKKLWSTKGATPEATLYAAMLREERDKGKESRFTKSGRGLFAAKGA